MEIELQRVNQMECKGKGLQPYYVVYINSYWKLVRWISLSNGIIDVINLWSFINSDMIQNSFHDYTM